MDEKKFIEFYHLQKESGLTVKEFCSNEVIAPSTFYYWQKKLKSRNRLPGFIPVAINSAPELSPQGFQDGLFPASVAPRAVEIEFPNKTIIRIRGELGLPVLKALIHLND